MRVLAALLVLGWMLVAEAQPMGFDPQAVYRVPLGDSPRKGPDDAAVTVVAFSDFGCSYCALAEATLSQLARLYPGKLRLVYRHFPLDAEDGALAAELSLAAAKQGRFWAMKERLFAARGRVDRAGAEILAAELGLDMRQVRTELDAGTHRRAVQADIADALALGVSATPTFFVNGRPLRGNRKLAHFVRVVDEELARAEAQARGSGRNVYERLIERGRASADAALDLEPSGGTLAPSESYGLSSGPASHALGPADALVTIFVWTDFECPFCARNLPVLAQIRRKYGDDVRLVVRHFPLPGHRRAGLAAEAAIAAAAQGKFWEFHDRLFASGAIDRASLEGHARALGLDEKLFAAALDERRYREWVLADAAAASALGVAGTPTMFINGTPVEGVLAAEELGVLIDAHLESGRRLVASGVARADVFPLANVSATHREHGDPQGFAVPGASSVGLRQSERGAAVMLACRRRDAAMARPLAATLVGEVRVVAASVCAPLGIDF
jgi:protein-disulfide isomerase